MTKDELLQIIEDGNFKRIADSIRFLWGNKECDDYLNKIIIDDRGNRAGFPFAIGNALLALHKMHMEEFQFSADEKFSFSYYK